MLMNLIVSMFYLQRDLAESASLKQGLNSNAGTMSNISTLNEDSLDPTSMMQLSTSSGGIAICILKTQVW